MNLKLKPRVFLIGFLPGFLFICGIILTYKQFDFHQILIRSKEISLIVGFAIIILSFIVGQVFDSFREWVIENRFAKCWEKKDREDIYWDFFYNASDEDIDKLDNNYYLFYVLNLDLSICLSVLILASIANLILILFSVVKCDCFAITTSLIFIAIYGISIFLLVKDASILREEIAKHTNKSNNEK